MLLSLTLILLTLSPAMAAESRRYTEEGADAELSPGPVTQPVTSILWKHGADIAAEWYGDQHICYRDYKGRCELNTTTGALTIWNVSKANSGSYSAEINSRVLTTVELLVISPVRTPNVSKWCSPGKTFCLLTCEGNTTGAEPVSYYWMLDGVKQSSSKVLNISKDEPAAQISCVLENPVSNKSSAVPNPFLTGKRNHMIFICLLLIVCGSVVGFLIFKHVRVKKDLRNLVKYEDGLTFEQCRGYEKTSNFENESESPEAQQQPPVSVESNPGETSHEDGRTDPSPLEQECKNTGIKCTTKVNAPQCSEDLDEGASKSLLEGQETKEEPPSPDIPHTGDEDAEEEAAKIRCRYHSTCRNLSKGHIKKYRHEEPPSQSIIVKFDSKTKYIVATEEDLENFLTKVRESFSLPTGKKLTVTHNKAEVIGDSFKHLLIQHVTKKELLELKVNK